MSAPRKDEQFGLEVRQPIRTFGQQDLARLKLCGGDCHATRFIAFRFYCDYSSDLAPQFLNERSSGPGVFDQNTPRAPPFGVTLNGSFESGVIDALPPDIDEIPHFLAAHALCR